MTVSPELMKMVRRAGLPISIRADHYFNSWRMRAPGCDHTTFRAADARRAYLALRTELESAAPSPTTAADTAAGCSDASPPEVS